MDVRVLFLLSEILGEPRPDGSDEAFGPPSVFPLVFSPGSHSVPDMARFVTTVPSSLPPGEAFAKLAAFERVPEWDPNTSAGTRVGADLGPGTEFDITTVFGGRTLELRYRMSVYEPGMQVVVEATMPNGTYLRDAISFAPTSGGCDVTYDARITPKGVWKLANPVFQVIFGRIGAKVVEPLTRYLSAP